MKSFLKISLFLFFLSLGVLSLIPFSLLSLKSSEGNNLFAGEVFVKPQIVSSDNGHTLALDTFGNVWSWGENFNGTLGREGDGLIPTKIELGEAGGVSVTLPKMKMVQVGEIHSLSLDVDGNVWSWGDNWAGQLGHGDTIQRNVPTKIEGVEDFSNIEILSSGEQGSSSFAIDANGSIWSWGANWAGQLGLGDTTQRNAPEKIEGVAGFFDIKMVVSGIEDHSFALDSDGNVWSWGENWAGQLGHGDTIQRNVPTRIEGVEGFSNLKMVAGGHFHSLALDSDGNVWSWGDNGVGQLGHGDKTQRNVPTRIEGVAGFSDIKILSSGNESVLALDSENNFWGWGRNGSGELGFGDTEERLIPTKNTAISNLDSIYMGSFSSFAITTSGEVLAWGFNPDGQLGFGDTDDRDIPEVIPSLSLPSIQSIIKQLVKSELDSIDMTSNIFDILNFYNTNIPLNISRSEVGRISFPIGLDLVLARTQLESLSSSIDISYDPSLFLFKAKVDTSTLSFLEGVGASISFENVSSNLGIIGMTSSNFRDYLDIFVYEDEEEVLGDLSGYFSWDNVTYDSNTDVLLLPVNHFTEYVVGLKEEVPDSNGQLPGPNGNGQDGSSNEEILPETGRPILILYTLSLFSLFYFLFLKKNEISILKFLF